MLLIVVENGNQEACNIQGRIVESPLRLSPHPNPPRHLKTCLPLYKVILTQIFVNPGLMAFKVAKPLFLGFSVHLLTNLF